MLSATIHRGFLRRKPPLPPPPKHRRCFSSVEYPPIHHQPEWSGLNSWRRSPLNRDRRGARTARFTSIMKLKALRRLLSSGPVLPWRKWAELFSPPPTPSQKLSSLTLPTRSGGGRVCRLESPMRLPGLLVPLNRNWYDFHVALIDQLVWFFAVILQSCWRLFFNVSCWRLFENVCDVWRLVSLFFRLEIYMLGNFEWSSDSDQACLFVLN